MAELCVQVLQRRGHSVEAAVVQAAMPAFEPFLERFQADGELAFASDSKTTALWHAYYRATLAGGASHLSEDEIAACAVEVTDLYGLPDYWETYPEVAPTLREGWRRGLVQGVVSDWGTPLISILHGLGLSDLLDFVVVSALAGAAKPNSYLFDLAVQRAGVAREEILYVGDTYRSDILGGRGAGLHSVLIDRSGALSSIDCPVIHRLDQILDLAVSPPDEGDRLFYSHDRSPRIGSD